MENKSGTYSRLFFSFGKLLLASYLITGVLLLLLAMLLYKFRISRNLVNIGIIVVYCLSTFITGFLAGKSRKQKKFIWGLLLGAAYFMLLCLISLAVNGSIQNLGGNFMTAMILCVGSGMLGGMLS